MKKQFLAILLTLAMALTLLPTAALAAGSGFSIENGVLTKYSGPGGEVTIPSGVTSIGPAAFFECTDLISIEIPDSVTSIGTVAFANCTGLISVTIPSSVTSIGSVAFSNCTGLTAIEVEEENQNYASVDGVLFTAAKDKLLQCPAGKQGVYTVPDGVTGIEEWAFYRCIGLTSVTVPNSVASIGDFAFFDCAGLTGVTIGSGVTGIANRVFMGCAGLTSVTIPDGVTSIGDGAFYGCTSLTSVAIPSSVTSIGMYVFDVSPRLKDVYYGGTEAQWKAAMTWYFKYPSAYDALASVAIHYNSAAPSQPQPPDQPQSLPANPTNDKLTVDGKAVTPTAYKIDNANYFKLRDVAALLDGSPKKFSVDYDNAAKAVTITTGQAYQRLGTELADTPASSQSAIVSNNEVYINGEKTELAVYKINGENYFQIRDLAKKLDFNVGWTKERGMFIEGDKSYDPAN